MAATKKPAKPKAPKLKGFTPTPAPVAPAGTYDPSLDAGLRAANRGLLYTQQDAEKANERASTSYTSGLQQSEIARGSTLADILTGKTRTQQDLTTSHDRGTVDLATALSRSQEDTGRLSSDLRRNYADLGDAQTSKASSGAFVDSGSIAAAAGRRTENQGRDQAGIDLNQSRFVQDNSLQRGRLNQDFASGVARSNEDALVNTGRANLEFDQRGAGLAQALQYGVDDSSTAVGRAQAENNFYGQDVAGAKMYQATSSGLYTPPVKPSNEHSDAKGPYQLIITHGLRFKLRPNGTREPAGVAR